MNLEHNQTVELDSSFFDGCDVELVPISGIEEYTEDCPMDITVESGYFQDASGLQCKNCGSHSIEYLKKYGLKNISNLRTDSNPAKSASVLTGHLNTFIASMQANYAGALGFGYINTFYAPLLVGMDDKQLHQTAQEMIFNGSQNAFSRGGQSLHPDELIWVKRDGKYQSVHIGEFADAYIDGHPADVQHQGQYEIYKTDNEDIQAISFEKENGRVLDKQVMYVARMPHKGRMYRVHTSNGIVNITGDHSVFTFHGKGDIRPTKASALKKGDFVVIPHKVNLEGTQTHVDITRYIPEEWLSVYGYEDVLGAIKKRGTPTKVLAEVGETRYIMRDGKRCNKVRVSLAKHFVDILDSELCIKGDSQAHMPAKLPLTRELGYLAGMFCSEGHQAFKKVLINNADQAILDKVEKSLKGIGYTWYNRDDRMSKGCTVDRIDISGVLGAFIKMSCADGKQKIVPDWVYTAPEDCIEGFIEGFYDGEGANRKAKPDEWSVSNTSTRVIAGMSLLMLRKGRETYVYETRHENSTWSDVYELRESKQRKVNPFTDYTTVEGYNAYKKGMKPEKREAVDWLLESDLSVSIIKKIEEYDYDGPVYDISVPGTEAFLGGLGSVFFKNTVFSDYNIDTGVPVYLKGTPAIHAGGKYMAKYNIDGGDWRDGELVPLTETTDDGHWALKFQNPHRPEDNGIAVKDLDGGKRWMYEAPNFHVMCYGDYEEEAQKFAHALLDVWGEGDARGRVFEFPKCDFHVRAETFTDPKQYEVFMHACRLAAKNGSTYFVFDRDSVSLSSCCRLRTKITDMSMLNHPESLRTLGFQNVTINIPQAAFRAARAGEKTLDGLFKQIDAAMDLAMDAHRQKRAFIATLMDGPGKPLWQMGKPACDGKPYVDLDSAMYIIGLIGVNEAVQFMTGKQLHESDEAYKMGLEITGHMYLRCQKYTKETGMQVRLEESPAESAARRLAKADLVFYRDEALSVYKGGDEDHAYYTNSIHIVADADIDALERAWKQAVFNSIIEAGAITHLFIGEQEPDPGSIASLIKWIFLNTQSAQVTISPEFTYCNTCGKKSRGLYDKCQHCGSTDVIGETRIVGYYSPVQSWNLSKLAELRARQRGRYAVEGVQA